MLAPPYCRNGIASAVRLLTSKTQLIVVKPMRAMYIQARRLPRAKENGTGGNLVESRPAVSSAGLH